MIPKLGAIRAIAATYSRAAMFESGEITAALSAADEIAALVSAHRDDPGLAALLDAWVSATRETAAGRIIARAGAGPRK